MFCPYLPDAVELVGVEAGGRGKEIGRHAARFRGQPSIGIAQGYKSYFLQNEEGQIAPTHSISAGLDYPGVGPEMAYLYDQGRVIFESVSDEEALYAYKKLARLEGIIPALESAHAVAYILRRAPHLNQDQIAVVNISGRGDKYLFITAASIDRDNWRGFLKRELS